MMSPNVYKGDEIIMYEQQNRIADAYLIPTDDLIPNQVNESPGFDFSDEISILERRLNASSNYFSAIGLRTLKDHFRKIPIELITTQHVKILMNKFPPIQLLETQQDVFDLLSYLTQTETFAQIIFETKILQSIDYSVFPSLEEELKSKISLTLFNIVWFAPESKKIFINIFFPYLLQILVSENAYEYEELGTFLNLAGSFVELLFDPDLSDLFCVFAKFVESTIPDVSQASIDGLTAMIAYKKDYILPALNRVRHSLLDRLPFLASQNKNGYGPAAFRLLSYIFSFQDLDLTEKECNYIFSIMCHILQKQDGPCLYDALYFLSFLFHNEIFIYNVEICKLGDIFLSLYQKLNINQKKESVISIANMMAFFPMDYINVYFSQQGFFDALLDALEFDEPEIISPLMDGLHRVLTTSNEILKMTDQRQYLYEKLTEIANAAENENVHRKATIILEVLTIDE